MQWLKNKKVVGALVGALTLVLAGVTGMPFLTADVVDTALTEIVCGLLACS